MILRLFISIFCLIILASCGGENTDFEDIITNPPSPKETECNLVDGWSIPPIQIVGGGVGKEGIPSLENPDFVPESAVDFLSENDLLVGVEIDGQVRLYPHRIMDRHEVANDQIGQAKYSLTFCPLTGSTVVVDRQGNDSYGVSGLLHNSNLIYYNRATNDFWAQMKLTSIKGGAVCESTQSLGSVEMTWEAWKKTVNNISVLDLETGFDKDYSDSFSAAILEDNTPLWPFSPKDNRLKNFEKVYVLFIDGYPKAYPLNGFDDETKIIRDAILGNEIILVSNKEDELITAFDNKQGLNYSLSTQDGQLQISHESKRWNIFGSPIIGTVSKLEKPTGYMAYWFAVGATFPNIEIYNPHGED